MIDTTEIFLAINSCRKNGKKKPTRGNIYQQSQKEEKHKELECETFNQVTKNLLLFAVLLQRLADSDSFYISNDDVIIESFDNFTLMRQDINEKENKIRDFEILSEVSELRLNEIISQIKSIHTFLNNVT